MGRAARQGLRAPQPAAALPALCPGRLPTPSGKCEFYSERMAQDGYDPLPGTPRPPGSRPRTVNRHNRPLISISPRRTPSSTAVSVNVDRLRRREAAPPAHPPGGRRARDIADAATVRVWNERGEVHLVAALRRRPGPRHGPRPGVWWAKFSPDRRNVNQLHRPAAVGHGRRRPSTMCAPAQVAPVALLLRRKAHPPLSPPPCAATTSRPD